MHTEQFVIVVSGLAQSGVGKSRKCCFPHGMNERFVPSFKFFGENLCSPNEDFERPNGRLGTFCTFQRNVDQIEDSPFEKNFEKTWPNPCSPNEDFGRQNKRSVTQNVEKCFETTTQNVCSSFENLRLGSIKLKKRL